MVKYKWEFFERFKINKQVVQAGAPYVIYIYGVRKKQEPSILILIDLESLSRLSTEQLEKDIITMKSLILAQDER